MSEAWRAGSAAPIRLHSSANAGTRRSASPTRGVPATPQRDLPAPLFSASILVRGRPARRAGSRYEGGEFEMPALMFRQVLLLIAAFAALDPAAAVQYV